MLPVYCLDCRPSGHYAIPLPVSPYARRKHCCRRHDAADSRWCKGDGYSRRKPAGPKAGKHDEADDRSNGVLAGHSNSRSRLDLVPCQFERPHYCFRLSHRKESVNASSTFVRVLCQGTSDHSSNGCLLSTNGHEAPHNVEVATRRTSYHVRRCARLPWQEPGNERAGIPIQCDPSSIPAATAMKTIPRST